MNKRFACRHVSMVDQNLLNCLSSHRTSSHTSEIVRVIFLTCLQVMVFCDKQYRLKKYYCGVNHYRKLANCRVPEPLPCAETRAHGKPDLCRVLEETAHDKGSTHGNNFICRVSAQKTHGKGTTHGKHVRLPCAEKGCTRQIFSTRQRAPVCRVPAILHTTNLWHTAKLCKKK